MVDVVSTLHKRGSNDQLDTSAQLYNSWVAYGLSKLALVHFTFELQRRFAAQGLNAYCLHPGSVNTQVGVKGMATSPLIQSIVKALAPMQSLFMLSPEEGAQTQIKCTTEPELGGVSIIETVLSPSPAMIRRTPLSRQQYGIRARAGW